MIAVQVPVDLGFAITVHKAQGRTLERFRYDPGGPKPTKTKTITPSTLYKPCGEWTSNLTFTALSRGTSIKSIMLESLDDAAWTWPRWRHIGNHVRRLTQARTFDEHIKTKTHATKIRWRNLH